MLLQFQRLIVVVIHALNMALYFPQAGNLIGSNYDTCSNVAGQLISSSGDLFELSDTPVDNRSRTFTISPTTSTTSRHLGFESDYNYHTAFQAC